MQRYPILSVRDLSVHFGGVVALSHISFDVLDGEICGIIGPNGAGKTTLFNCVSHLVRFRRDAITFGDIPLGGLHPSLIAMLGIGRTFQNLALFGSLTVIENIMLGAHSRSQSGVLSNVLGFRSAKIEEDRTRAEAWDFARLVGLETVGGAKVSDLPFGFQKRVELARALASRPKLLLLDEPAAGLIHDEVDALGDLIEQLRTTLGLTVLMVEHHMGFTMKLCQRIIVLNFGKKIAEGVPSDIQRNPDVIEAYLGVTQ